jgi:hypothetical protein
MKVTPQYVPQYVSDKMFLYLSLRFVADIESPVRTTYTGTTRLLGGSGRFGIDATANPLQLTRG